MKHPVVFKTETTFGTEPAGGIERLRSSPLFDLADVNLRTWSKAEKTLAGGVTFTCPECGGEVDTHKAALCLTSPDGLQWQGTPCSGCGQTYTVEAVRKEEL